MVNLRRTEEDFKVPNDYVFWKGRMEGGTEGRKRETGGKARGKRERLEKGKERAGRGEERSNLI